MENTCTIISATTTHFTIDNFFVRYLQNLHDKEKADNTINSHIFMYHTFVKPIVGHLAVESLTLIHGDHIASLAKKSAESNAPRAVITFRQLLKFITRCGYRLPFDWRDVEIPVYRIKKKVYAYSSREIKDIREYLSTEHIKRGKYTSESAEWEHKISMARMRALFELNLHSGLRISECPPINKADIDWQASEIRIINSKTGSLEKVYFNGARKALLEYIKMRKDTNPALFVTHTGKRITKNGLKTHFRVLSNKFKKARKLLTTKTLASHTLRKTFCTQLIRTPNVDIKSVQKLARHQSIRTTLNHYAALDEDRCADIHKRAMRKF